MSEELSTTLRREADVMPRRVSIRTAHVRSRADTARFSIAMPITFRGACARRGAP
jgi:hypothetical protein